MLTFFGFRRLLLGRLILKNEKIFKEYYKPFTEYKMKWHH